MQETPTRKLTNLELVGAPNSSSSLYSGQCCLGHFTSGSLRLVGAATIKDCSYVHGLPWFFVALQVEVQEEAKERPHISSHKNCKELGEATVTVHYPDVVTNYDEKLNLQNTHNENGKLHTD